MEIPGTWVILSSKVSPESWKRALENTGWEIILKRMQWSLNHREHHRQSKGSRKALPGEGPLLARARPIGRWFPILRNIMAIKKCTVLTADHPGASALGDMSRRLWDT